MSVKEYVPDINSKIHETSVDFILRECAKEVHIVQYDKTQPIVMVRLYEAGIKYVLPDSAIVNLRFSKPDSTFVYKQILGCDKTRTIVYFDVDEQMTLLYGKVNPILELIIGTTVSGTSPIPFEIDRNPIQNGDIESKVDVSAIMDGIGKANETANEALKVANEAKKITDNVVTKDELSKEVTSINGKINNAEKNAKDYTDSKIATIDLTSYVNKEYLTTVLENYTTVDFIDEKLKDYISKDSLTLILNGYVTDSSLNITLSNYATITDLDSKLSNYVTTSYFTNEFKKYAKITYVDIGDANTLQSAKEYTDLQIKNIGTDIFVDKDTLLNILKRYVANDDLVPIENERIDEQFKN